MEKRLFWVFLFVFIDILGFSLIIPLTPYIGKEFNASPSLMGLLLTSNAIAQMFANPWIGSLSDSYGRRPLLLVCIAGTVISFIMMGAASSVTTLFLSRILDGLLGGNISLAQAYITDITDEKNRSKGFGMIGAAFGLGFIVGPAIGGTLSSYGFRIPAYCAAAIATLNFIGVFFFLPESMVKKETTNKSNKLIDEYQVPIRLVSVFFKRSKDAGSNRIRMLLLLRFFYYLCFTLWETSFAFYNLQVLQLEARKSSYLLALFGIVFAAVQGGGMRIKWIKANEGRSIVAGFVLCAFSLLLWCVSTTVISTIVALLPLAFSCGLLNTLISSHISKNAHKSEIGGVLGLSSSIGSLTRIIAPLSSGILIDHYGVSSTGIVGFAVAITMAYYSFRSQLHVKTTLNSPDPHSSTPHKVNKSQ